MGWTRATVGGGRSEEDWRGVGFLCYFLSPGERKKVRLNYKVISLTRVALRRAQGDTLFISLSVSSFETILLRQNFLRMTLSQSQGTCHSSSRSL